jgi:hypothetical protein
MPVLRVTASCTLRSPRARTCAPVRLSTLAGVSEAVRFRREPAAVAVVEVDAFVIIRGAVMVAAGQRQDGRCHPRWRCSGRAGRGWKEVLFIGAVSRFFKGKPATFGGG